MSAWRIRRKLTFNNKKLVCGRAGELALESRDEMVFITSLVARQIF